MQRLSTIPVHEFRSDSTQVSSVTTDLQLAGLGDLFKIGIGPSSSHTIGPMKAASAFRAALDASSAAPAAIVVTLFGSLAWTGKGHASDKAVTLGLIGAEPETVDPEKVDLLVAEVQHAQQILLADGRAVRFSPDRDIVFDRVHTFAQHSNALTFEAFDNSGASVLRELWFSVGGGFVVRDGVTTAAAADAPVLPYPYQSAAELLAFGKSTGRTIAAIALANECARYPQPQVLRRIDHIASVMLDCISRGLRSEGELPGGLRAQRRARDLFSKLEADRTGNKSSSTAMIEYVSAYAMAVNEENACGGRLVTAPTNGAAGVVPAVLRYYLDFCPGANTAGTHAFFLAATAVGALIRRNASISGAEVGCQGEIGSAASMAAAGLAAALGGSNEQVENAAEIAMEHHLGMTCDPVGGLVQIPCIERNAFGAVKAINAASLALRGDGTHRVSLDQVIETMRQTGRDMQTKYKETSLGGLAVNVPAC